MGGSNCPASAASGRGFGQVLAIVVIALPALMGGMGLATDVASLYLNHVRLQTAADASVLSGARYLPDQPDQAIATANAYASQNGVATGEITSTTVSNDTSRCPAPALACQLTMNLRRIVPFYFARLVGVGSGTVKVSASAAAGTPAGSINRGLVPIGLQYTTPYSDGARVTLSFTSPTTPSHALYSWSALSLGGSTFTGIFANGYSGRVSINDPEPPDRSATTTGPVNFAIQTRINAGRAVDSAGSYSSYTANDLRAVTIALVDWAAAGGCCRIKGLAHLWLESVSNANITGYWIAGGINGSPDLTGTAPNEGALSISLTQ
jgi:Putative Flp pilus-assembly TadE/G-like